jgi:hypothetical protein
MEMAGEELAFVGVGSMRTNIINIGLRNTNYWSYQASSPIHQSTKGSYFRLLSF